PLPFPRRKPQRKRVFSSRTSLTVVRSNSSEGLRVETYLRRTSRRAHEASININYRAGAGNRRPSATANGHARSNRNAGRRGAGRSSGADNAGDQAPAAGQDPARI